MKTLLQLLLALPQYFYYLYSRQAYIVSGTFIDKEGKRMFCRTIFTTSFYRMPLHDLEVGMAKKFNCDSVLILFFHQIPWRQAKYIEMPHPNATVQMEPIDNLDKVIQPRT